MATPTNLAQYYSGQGQSLPSVSARSGVASQAGVTGPYTGTAIYGQNIELRSISFEK